MSSFLVRSCVSQVDGIASCRVEYEDCVQYSLSNNQYERQLDDGLRY